ncbi:MAG TPA: hypothetical protein VEF76_14130 [Patescibacteria group bacterium]|nr:hypothetical protein [Patescibacteria group bacterium]
MFPEVEEVRARLQGFPADYWIAGGWAVDLRLGRQTRPHHDIEIAIDRRDQRHLLGMPGLDRIEYAHSGQLFGWAGEGLRLPVHEMYAYFRDGFKLEVLLNEFEASDWVYRRNFHVKLEYARFAPGEALPAVVVLLYKSKNPRPKDGEDFQALLPLLDGYDRLWLREAIARDYPHHHWLGDLK